MNPQERISNISSKRKIEEEKKPNPSSSGTKRLKKEKSARRKNAFKDSAEELKRANAIINNLEKKLEESNSAEKQKTIRELKKRNCALKKKVEAGSFYKFHSQWHIALT